MSEESPSKKVKLTYLDGPGLAESVRLVLCIGDVPFVDERISYEEIKVRRAGNELPYGQVPTLTMEDGCVYGQKNAILRWAGRQAGLYPDECQLKCDGVVEAIHDINSKLYVFHYEAALGRNPITSEPVLPLSDDQKAQVGPYFNDTLLPERFKQLDMLLASSGGSYFCGEQLTICDVDFYCLAWNILSGRWTQKGIKPECLDQCLHLQALVKRIGDHEAVRRWQKRQHIAG
eukprot:TRINITY_DN51059_c0_g1_i1.p1 TRINITY_DN51059_c0_g1~~TRINITY_DN51059_c0_g1_i1.p1  ORF type:complete len:232 (+),score=38.34 TRINITY_DN51059_c0_g1_i1:41-736(+)